MRKKIAIVTILLLIIQGTAYGALPSTLEIYAAIRQGFLLFIKSV